MALELRQNVLSAQFLENKLTKDHEKFNIHSYLQDQRCDCYIYFSQTCSRVMTLDLRQNFVSTQYHKIKLTEFHQILYMHSY